MISLATIAVIFAGSTASAVEFSMLSDTTITVLPGGSATLDIALSNNSLTAVTGVVGTITGLAGAGAVATSGQSALAHFNGFCSPSNCFGGINSNPNAFFDDDDLSASGAYSPGDDSIVIVSALALAATSLNGAIDPGLDGALNVPSARDVSITFSFATPGTHILTVGGTFASGGSQPITSTATVTVNVVPEPGTALLMGLGLAGLTLAGRRQS